MPNPTKILTVIGARPQFVKASVVSRAFARDGRVEESILHTGQHFSDEMSAIFFRELGIPAPKYDLGINTLSHGAMTGRMLEEIEKVIVAEDPDWVLVYGDTNSTLAGALAARKLHRRVAHVEAGLRSFDMRMPEEVNRILTDRISDILFCPTTTAVANLEGEGFRSFPVRVVNTGDVMFDAVLFNRKRARLSPETAASLPQPLNDFVIATVHRAENTDNIIRLQGILAALEEIHRSTPVVLLVHPRTRKLLGERGISPKLWLAEPVGYLEMLYLIDKAQIVMTDSGGLQKEAFFLQKCCVTLRDNTEWTELVDLGVNVLAGSNREKIIDGFQRCISGEFDFSATPYGDGTAGEKIVKSLLQSYDS
jgi:UDP-GlcNAc3NAcA epimerase